MPGPSHARLEFSGCRVKPRRPRSRQGFIRQPVHFACDSLRTPNVQIVPTFENTTKIQREDSQRKTKRAKMEAGKKPQKERNFGRSGGGVQRKGEPEGPKSTTTPTPNTHTTQQHITKMDWPNGLAKNGLAQIGLAKVGHRASIVPHALRQCCRWLEVGGGC